MATRKDDERIFNTQGRKHYRRTYSLTEARISVAIFALLAGIAGWITWKGQNPDPELFSVSEDLLDQGSQSAPERARALAPGMAADEGSGTGTGTGGAAGGQGAAGDRGPLPAGLAAEGWREVGLSSFDNENLYVKINGRAGYYQSFGFQRLYFLSLQRDETTVVDIEMYDQGTAANALGAYAGERQPDSEPTISNSGISHLSRNALFLVRGRYYIRAIGSDESEAVRAQLAHLDKVFASGLTAEPLPWAFTLFVGQLSVDPGKIGYLPENAFSFGFARNVYTAEVSADGAEIFTTAVADEKTAAALAKQFADGFLSYGKDAGKEGEVQWVEDQYLSTIAGATAVKSLVIGVRGAPDKAFAGQWLGRLKAAGSALSDEVLAQAASAQAAALPASGGGYGEAPEAGEGGQGGETNNEKEGGGPEGGAPEEGY